MSRLIAYDVLFCAAFSKKLYPTNIAIENKNSFVINLEDTTHEIDVHKLEICTRIEAANQKVEKWRDDVENSTADEETIQVQYKVCLLVVNIVNKFLSTIRNAYSSQSVFNCAQLRYTDVKFRARLQPSAPSVARI